MTTWTQVWVNDLEDLALVAEGLDSLASALVDGDLFFGDEVNNDFTLATASLYQAKAHIEAAEMELRKAIIHFKQEEQA